MSTQINVTIGDQRLLQDNKTRAAANQQALDDRKANKQLEQKATKAAKAANPQETPGALPNTKTDRSPTANRPKNKYEAGLLLLDTASLISFYGSFYNTIFLETGNLVYYQSASLDPKIFKYELPPANPNIYQPLVSINAYSPYSFTIPYVILEYFTAGKVTNFPLKTFHSRITIFLSLHSGDAEHTYLSYVFIYNIIKPTITSTTARIDGATKVVSALYIRFNNTDNTYSSRVYTLSESQDSSVKSTTPPARLLSTSDRLGFVANMYQDDPRAAIYRETGSLDRAIDPTLNGITYNNKTGALYIAAESRTLQATFVVRGDVGKDQPYSGVLNGIGRTAKLRIQGSYDLEVATSLPPDGKFEILNRFVDTYGPANNTSAAPDVFLRIGLATFYDTLYIYAPFGK